MKGAGGGVTKKQYRGGGIGLKRGAWTICRFKRGGLGKKEGVVFLREGGWYCNAHYIFISALLTILMIIIIRGPWNSSVTFQTS